MRKKILCIAILMLLITTTTPVIGTSELNQSTQKKEEISTAEPNPNPFWNPPHWIEVNIDKLYVYDCGDSRDNEPGEYFFSIFSIPKFYFYRTQTWDVYDNTPEIPYDIGTLNVFDVKFTPQIIILFASEEDKGEGPLNFNEFMGYTIIKVNPPKGDYPPGSPWEMEPVVWETMYFKAVIKIYFGQK